VEYLAIHLRSVTRPFKETLMKILLFLLLWVLGTFLSWLFVYACFRQDRAIEREKVEKWLGKIR